MSTPVHRLGGDAPVTTRQQPFTAREPIADEFRRLVALVVDDSSSARKMLRLMLRKWDFEVLEAEDGFEALGHCQSRAIDFVISDWMMPEMTGPELCSALRKQRQKHYTYIILLTAKSEKEAISEGLDAGADDFLTKPTDMGELRSRLRAGQRLIRMQDDLVDKNQRITQAFDKLNAVYESIDQDLKAAARLQQALIPERQTRCGALPIGLTYHPSGHVGGDLLGFYPASESRVAAFSIDVSGHGVSAALMTARLANLFNAQHLDENIGIRRLPSGEYHPRDPSAIAAELNDRLQDETDTDQYFTMLFADVNTDTGMIRFCQAGHPNAAMIRGSGAIEFVGEGGAPIGLIPGMKYETNVVHLEPGDRFMMFSDGITEAEDLDGNMLEEEGLAAILRACPRAGEKALLDHVVESTLAFTGAEGFGDDVSALLLTMP